MTTIENDQIRVVIQDHGAQMSSLFDKTGQTEWLWQANPAFWGRHAPVLFPIVGRLVNDQYRYDGQFYTMKQHGFARDQVFKRVLATNDQAVFRLTENEQSLVQYPFAFELLIRYHIRESELSIEYEVRNTGDQQMPFSIGAHPAFNCPIKATEAFNDHQLVFDIPISAERHLLEGGLYNGETETVLSENDTLPLHYEWFDKDAIVFKHLEASSVQLQAPGNQSLDFQFAGFPYLGIWTKRDAPFICIEPWFGLADNITHQQDIFEKEGIIVLDPKEAFTCHYSMTINP